MGGFIDLEGRLVETCKGYGLAITEEQAELLVTHLMLVLEKNKQVNLTAITDPEEGLVLHVVDSLLLLPYLKDDDAFVDVGTGAGYPGIPLVICSPAKGTLIDSVGKKVSAVESFINELGLSDHCKADSVRAEDLAKTHPNSFSAVVARAVAPCNVLLEYASPLLAHNGRLILSKAPLASEEFDEGLIAAEIVGMSLVSRETLSLPDNLGEREILVYQKTCEPQIKLPRRPGMAKKRPLGK